MKRNHDADVFSVNQPYLVRPLDESGCTSEQRGNDLVSYTVCIFRLCSLNVICHTKLDSSRVVELQNPACQEGCNRRTPRFMLELGCPANPEPVWGLLWALHRSTPCVKQGVKKLESSKAVSTTPLALDE